PLHPPHPPTLSPLSLHDALPISADADDLDLRAFQAFLAERNSDPRLLWRHFAPPYCRPAARFRLTGPRTCFSASPPMKRGAAPPDRKSTRLNSSHVAISYAVFCL